METFLNPEEILNKLDLKKQMVAADFGSGSGGWAIPLAKLLKKGRVYAIDVLEEALSALRNKAYSQKITNIELIRVNLESKSGVPQISNDCCDWVLMTNLLFQLDNKETVFKEAKRILKPGGRVLVVDWMSDAPFGPKERRILPEETEKLAKDNGFKTESRLKAGLYHWGLILAKPR